MCHVQRTGEEEGTGRRHGSKEAVVQVPLLNVGSILHIRAGLFCCLLYERKQNGGGRGGRKSGAEGRAEGGTKFSMPANQVWQASTALMAVKY